LSWAPALYLITDRRASSRPLAEQVDSALSCLDPGRVAVQLREPDLTARELMSLGGAVLSICRRRGVPLLVNDRIDIASALGAQGAHLSGRSLPAEEARRILGPRAVIGVSCHSAEEVRRRVPGADFATWGPVYATPSKAKHGPPVGWEGIEEAKQTGVPLLALGGIAITNAGALAAHGFAGIACIRAVFAAPDPGTAARELLAAFLPPPAVTELDPTAPAARAPE
jgi:thiamine-phosphate pyrophosphorylase